MDVGQSKGLYGHYGDVFQASTYLTIPGTEETKNCLVEFQLKNGAHILMFSPLVAALSGGHTDLREEAYRGGAKGSLRRHRGSQWK